MERFAEILVRIHHQRLDRPFTYRVPPGMDVSVGSRVVVPFGPRRIEGYCIGLAGDLPAAAAEVKDIEEVLDDTPVLTEELIKLAGWGAARYLCSQMDFLQAMVPPGVRWVTGKWAAYSGTEEPISAACRYLQEKGPVKLSAWLKQFPEMDAAGVLRRLRREGVITVTSRDAQGMKPRTVREAVLTAEGRRAEPVGSKQALALEILRKDTALPLSHLADAGVSAATVRSLAARSWVEIREKEVRRDPLDGEHFEPEEPLPLTLAQKEALEQISGAINDRKSGVFLLHGVTGSGKTEVYLQAIARTASAGLGSIVLVPEIALTPQIIERFASRFGGRIAVLHSRLSAGERYDEWRRVAEGDAVVAIGARSAVFAPFAKLGLIILDEEHEATYKQDETPRYHAREVALWRARLHKAAVVLGSATPSLESYRLAELGEYTLSRLPDRIENRPMPPVEIVDMRQELKEKHRSIFSRLLLSTLESTFQQGKQAILLLNRRGYATFVLCRECGHVMRCKSCDISLKFHMAGEALRCHYCDYSEDYPRVCPVCSGRYIRHFGTGTQKVEEELLKYFPDRRVVRLDADTTARKGAHKKILTQFKKKEADVLIGTQMVAKGLDFPDVTLVGVITADTAINLPDFRAGERTFQLLTQVAGRAGRGPAGGRVVVQTYTPDHYAILAAKDHDYPTFYREESQTRQELGYPPYSVLVRLLLAGADEARVIDAASFLAAHLEGSTDILGPSPCPLEKIRGQFRWQLVARGSDTDTLLRIVKKASAEFGGSTFSGDVRLTLDVDPQSLL
ncbi:MAG: primosomal protein N' [Bacillota bacterium]|nr:primosomal protein N' [Bacillota bacterium]MDW7682589.1 primosomal protein N' [Bacillota bacterium]